MIAQIKTFKGNAIAIEVLEGFREADEKLVQKYFKQKIDEGHEHVNIIVKLDEMKLGRSDLEALIEDVIRFLRNYEKVGHMAIVAQSKILKFLVPIDNFFFKRMQKEFEERYFDLTELDKAIKFIKTGK